VHWTNFESPATIASAVVIGIGLVGVLLPVVPGLVLCWLGVLGWAVFGDAGPGRWAVLGIATVIGLIGVVAQFALPGRGLKRAGVSGWSIFLGGLLGMIGFFVVPIVGLVLGFVLGIWLSEQIRLGNAGEAWRATRQAVRAVGLSLLIELGAALALAAVWVAGVLLA
jgi:uncharacterized protein